MKKLFAIPIASLLLLGACSEKEDAVSGPETQGVVFELAAVNELTDGFSSRAPLYSQEAVQSVEVVNVYVFSKAALATDYTYVKTIPITWTKGTTFKRYEMSPSDQLAAGDYKFLAVGTDTGSPYTITTMVAGTTKFQDVTASLATLTNQELEIFSGQASALIVTTGARIGIQMSRQVAGVLGYFKNVPTMANGGNVKYLKLTASSANKSVNLTTGIGSLPLAVGTTYNVFNIDLSQQGDDGNTFNGNDLTQQGVVKVDRTSLYGAFLIPVNGITLTLGLYDQNNVALKTWNVVEAGIPLFNILPNHFYSLGIKTQSGNTNGGGGIGSIPDAPIDLLKDQVITITITPNWTLIHNLGIVDPLPI